MALRYDMCLHMRRSIVLSINCVVDVVVSSLRMCKLRMQTRLLLKDRSLFHCRLVDGNSILYNFWHSKEFMGFAVFSMFKCKREL